MSMHYYLHIPFCRQKCPYCKFALTPVFDDVKKKRYLGYLKREIREYFLSSRRDPFQNQIGEKNTKNLLSQGKRDFSSRGLGIRNDKIETQTIYFGGGTPSVLSLDEVKDILRCFNIPYPTGEGRGEGEITFECNPEDITSEYISGLLNLGINRLSIGVQSLNNETLKAIHRSNGESIFRALESIESSILSFGTKGRIHVLKILDPSPSSGGQERNISLNIDLILGLPFSKPGETLENIRELHKRFPFISHTSVYMLEDGLYPKEWKNESISEEDMQREYSEICEYFDSLGWHHYEISNWSRPGYECQHNMGYWDHTDISGFGLSATNYIGGKRWTNSDSFAGYYRGDVIDTEILTEDEKNLERLIHNLRTFCLDEGQYSREILDELERGGLIERKDGKIILTPAGIFRENTILSELIGR